MLVIRLSRQGRSKRPFYRVVLTEHTKPAQCIQNLHNVDI